jgi:uncharacterized protein YdhG (YjbR/CyaY superfamily)
MKQQKPGNRGPEARRGETPRSIDEYLAGVPEPARSTLERIRATIRSAAPPEATEIISYRIPAFKHKEMLIWFAAFTRHCSLFPTASVLDKIKKELRGFSTSKGSIHFPADRPPPPELIRKMVEARVAQIESKKRR